jgi:hypothetical protein
LGVGEAVALEELELCGGKRLELLGAEGRPHLGDVVELVEVPLVDL